jgi:anti-sigma-K factor RskA
MTSDDADDRAALAAEYVLGSLDADERRQAQALIESDTDFAALVRSWERRLGELNAMVESVEPPAEVWRGILARLDQPASSPSLSLQPGFGEPSPREEAISDAVADLTRRLRRWRESAIFASALAASLAAVILVFALAPDILPARLRPKGGVVEVVRTEIKSPSRYVAVLQQDQASPAFILTVDVEGRSLTVRRVAADPQPGKSYELWLVSDRFPAPRSLGVVGDREFTVDDKLAAYDQGTVTNATFAVSLEPEGGSPTGVATGPILWTGKLVQVLPSARTPAPSHSP